MVVASYSEYARFASAKGIRDLRVATTASLWASTHARCVVGPLAFWYAAWRRCASVRASSATKREVVAYESRAASAPSKPRRAASIPAWLVVAVPGTRPPVLQMKASHEGCGAPPWSRFVLGQERLCSG